MNNNVMISDETQSFGSLSDYDLRRSIKDCEWVLEDTSISSFDRVETNLLLANLYIEARKRGWAVRLGVSS